MPSVTAAVLFLALWPRAIDNIEPEEEEVQTRTALKESWNYSMGIGEQKGLGMLIGGMDRTP